MGWIVFNYKRCDNAEDCPIIRHCAKEMQVECGSAAVTYDQTSHKIVVNEALCSKHNCVSRVCTKDCADCFSYAETLVERWWEIEQVHKTETDAYYNNKDRYNSESVSLSAKLPYNECYEFIQKSNGLTILEITSVTGCCSAYDSIQILDLIPRNIYERYYKKTVLYTEEEVIQIEKQFNLDELPAILLYYKQDLIGKISGIYRNCEPHSKQKLREKFLNILLPYQYLI